ncbi:MAG: phosphomannomutase/phosphoglucomutase [Methylomonas sp.]|jgi:phosphomannomutase/phosphoglucomutase
MARIYSIIAAISTLLVLLAGGGNYWLSLVKFKNSEIAITTAKAQALSWNLSMQLEALQESVNGLAHSPDVIAALNNADPATMNNVAKKMQIIIPGALRVRLLLPTVDEPDLTSTPNMGFGDLEMAHATLKSKQRPVIQGEGEHRHLAITSAVSMNDRIIGVVLVSFKADLINQVLSSSPFKEDFVEIKQDQSSLGASGDPDAKVGESTSLSLENGRWIISFWPKTGFDFSELILILNIAAIPVLLIILIFFMGYRKLSEQIQRDQNTILKAIKDILSDKNLGNYPIQLDEMRPIITNMLQFKRAVQDKFEYKNPQPVVADDNYDVRFLEGKQHRVTRKLAPTKINKSVSQLVEEPIAETMAYELPKTETLKSETPFANIFRRYDIRGIAGKDLNEDMVANIGRAVGSEAKQLGVNSIVVGRDGRLSSPDLAAALISGLCAAGCNVEDMGVAPTPLLYFVTHHKEDRSGIMITGSHNPADYNGLKIVLNNETLAESRIQDIKERIEKHDYYHGEPGIAMQCSQFTDEYIGMMSEDIKLKKPLRVVVDCGNGAAGVLAPMLLKALGCDVIELYCTIDGHFPHHHPDPAKPENLVDLISAVKQQGADVGVAFDGDGDRLGVVDSDGHIILPDRLMMVFARDVLSRKPGAKILYDVKCSKHLDQQIRKYGGLPMMWKTGHSLLKAKLKESGAALAGELSGHIFFNDRWFGFDDALYAAARLLQILAVDGRPSAEIFADYPQSVNTPELNVALKEGENFNFVEQLCNRAHFNGGKVILIDGLRVEFEDGWGLVRASNTTPSLVLRFEADNEMALRNIQEKFKSLMLEIKPDLSLPF